MKILICGDVHASRSHMKYLFTQAKNMSVDLMIALGDFGFWPRNRYGVDFLQVTQGLARDHNIDVWWLDGNHEDHLWLQNEMLPHYDGINPIVTSSPGNHYPNIKYLPRGHRFTLDEVTFMAYGGAFSIDFDSRTDGIDWFDKIEDVDIQHVQSLDNDPVDVLLTHDVPLGKNLGYPDGPLTRQSELTRSYLSTLVNKTQPHFGFGGHHHKNLQWDISTNRGNCRYMIINCNETMERSWYLLNTEQIKTISDWSK